MKTESLDYYWTLAKKLIMVHGHAGLLKDNEDIGYVASAVMEADNKFDPSIGVLEGYRSMHAKFAILKLIKKKKQKRIIKTVSLDVKTTKISYEDQSFNTIDCDDVFNFSKLSEVLEESIIEQIKDRFLNSCTWEEIAEKHNITKQAAKLNVKHGLSKIRKSLCPFI
jgi:hypothetical protein